jgi:hypothetical protein
MVRQALDSYREYVFGGTAMGAHRALGTQPNLDEYFVLMTPDHTRRLCLAGIEMAEGVRRDLHASEGVSTRALTAANALVVLASDIYSHRKEVSSGTKESNIITAIMREFGSTSKQALLDSALLYNQIMDLYTTLRDREGTDATSSLYLQQLDNYIRGTLDWSRHTVRYNDENGRIIEDRISGSSAGGPQERLNLPSVSWWLN